MMTLFQHNKSNVNKIDENHIKIEYKKTINYLQGIYLRRTMEHSSKVNNKIVTLHLNSSNTEFIIQLNTRIDNSHIIKYNILK